MTRISKLPDGFQADASEHAQVAAEQRAKWLLLIHQLPPKPDYLRVKIGRHLQRVGAVAIKNSVYVLPARSESYEDLQWILREIDGSGGEAFIAEAAMVDGLSDDAVRSLFNEARNQDYADVAADAKAFLKRLRSRRGAGVVRTTADLEHDAARLQRRHDSIASLDFHDAHEGAVVRALLDEIHVHVAGTRSAATKNAESSRPNGAMWVTRRDVHADRMASAWLIRTFIDADARFRFVDSVTYAHRPGELRFDMFEGEYTHVADRCTFETLMMAFAESDPALRAIAEVVHDIDCKDDKFRRREAAGVAKLLDGITATTAADDARIERATGLFDDLYAAFGGVSVKSSHSARSRRMGSTRTGTARSGVARIATSFMLACVVAGVLASPLSAQRVRAAASRDTVLFVCEHGTVRSLIAKLLFERYASAAGLQMTAVSRGTAIDSIVPNWLQAALTTDQFALNGWRPQSLAPSDLANAGYVVTFDLPPTVGARARAPHAQWDSLPSVSANYSNGRDAIDTRVRRLVDSLVQVRSPKRRNPMQRNPMRKPLAAE